MWSFPSKPWWANKASFVARRKGRNEGTPNTLTAWLLFLMLHVDMCLEACRSAHLWDSSWNLLSTEIPVAQILFSRPSSIMSQQGNEGKCWRSKGSQIELGCSEIAPHLTSWTHVYTHCWACLNFWTHFATCTASSPLEFPCKFSSNKRWRERAVRPYRV